MDWCYILQVVPW